MARQNIGKTFNRGLRDAALAMGIALLAALLDEARGAEPSPVVDTQYGQVQGLREQDVASFKGIPYARAERWQAPQAPLAWDGIRAATDFAAPCAAVDGQKMAEGTWIKDGGADLFIDVPLMANASEDCLHLNVWAPVNARGAAVMVWLQPIGPASTPFFDGSAFARDGVVFVSLDYRQLTLGNFAHPALTAATDAKAPLARFQTMDQLAALRWVEDNIAAFGGDPDKVTLFGQSAGASSVLQLLALPATRGLVDRAIVQSAAAWSTPWTLRQMERLGSAFATRAGLPGANASAEQLRALAPDALPQLGVYNIDGRLQHESAADAIDAGRLLDVPLMIGWTDYDGSSLRHTTPEAIVAEASAATLAAYASDGLGGAALGYQMYTDAHVAAPARWLARKTASGAPTWLYVYSHVLSLQRGKAPGAAHGSEIPFVFDTWSKLPIPLGDDDKAVTRLMHSCWVSFAKGGTPACDGAPAWPAYSAETDAVMELAHQPRVLNGFRRAQLDAQENAWRSHREAEARDVEDALQRFEEALK